MGILIKNGRVVDPANKIDQQLDILIEGDIIKEIAPGLVVEDVKVIDASGKIVVPGLIDVHVHFRQPGQIDKETIETGSRAAAKGGFTTVIAEPNTIPPINTALRVKNVLNIARQSSLVNFYTKACITTDNGRRLACIPELKEAGAIAISDDGNPVFGRRLMAHAFITARRNNIQVSPHCEESEYYRQRVKQRFGTEMPLWQDYCAEAGFVKREIELAERIGWSVHISHVSLADSVRQVSLAKKRGVRVTSEATPHHFTLTDTATQEKTNTLAKVNPPLRSIKDVEAIKEGLKDGSIDVIATDHAPHTSQEKDLPWDKAAFGMIGLETSLGLVLTELVQPGILSLSEAIAKMTINPAKAFGLEAGELKRGKIADITLIDPLEDWVVDLNLFESKSRNCPFHNWNLQGRAILTMVKGKIVMEGGRLLP